MLSLFSGIGAFERALEILEIPFDLVGYCEIDKYASKAYSLMHNVPENLNLGNIMNVDESTIPKDLDLITYGFPCTQISIAGTKAGFFDKDGNKTQSGLFYDAMRIIRSAKPKVAIAENVKHLTTKSMSNTFSVVLSNLEEAGYNNYWQVMNAADFGIPQSRERVLIVSIRKDIDNCTFKFPNTIPLTTCMNDFLDDVVPENFYLSEEKIKRVMEHNENHAGQVCDRGGAM